MPYTVLIVGAGKIGAFFDSPQSDAVLTHAHAFKKHPNFQLVGFVDVDHARAREAAQVWGCRAFSDLDDAFRMHAAIDVVVIATPDTNHSAYVRALFSRSVRLAFVEKPLTNSISDAQALAHECRTHRLPALVNYSRRFVTEFNTLKEEIAAGTFGKFLSGTGYYGKGILHNGSHMINLLRFLIGEVVDFERIDSIADYQGNDESVSAVLRFSDGAPFVLQIIDSRVVTVFELDLFFSKRRIRVKDSGFTIEESRVGGCSRFKGYTVYHEDRSYPTSLGCSLENAVEHIAEFFNGQVGLRCDIADSVKDVECCLRIAGNVDHE
jgi:predicted dehydrogenase